MGDDPSQRSQQGRNLHSPFNSEERFLGTRAPHTRNPEKKNLSLKNSYRTIDAGATVKIACRDGYR